MQPDDLGTTTDRPSVGDRLEVVEDAGAGPIPDQVTPPTVVVHTTRLEEQGPFVVAMCACGWRSYARRSRPLARSEAHDHILLHAGA